MKYYIFILLSNILVVSGQLMVKKGASLLKGDSKIEYIMSIFNIYNLIGGVCILAVPFITIALLSIFELSYLYQFSAINYFLVIIGDKVFYKENINNFHWIGATAIVIGLIVGF